MTSAGRSSGRIPLRFRNESAGSGGHCRLLLEQLTLPGLQTTVAEEDWLYVPGEPKGVDEGDRAEEVPRIDHGVEGDRRGAHSHS
jgi:hypothetical protein